MPALATGNHLLANGTVPYAVRMLPHQQLNVFFEAVAEAVEESIVNVLCAAQTMTGYKGHTVYALPLDALQRVMAMYRRDVRQSLER